MKPRKAVEVAPRDWQSRAGGLGTPSVMLTVSCPAALPQRAVYPCPMHVSFQYLLDSVLCSRCAASSLCPEDQVSSLLFCGAGNGAVVEKESRPFYPGSVPPVSLMPGCFVERSVSCLEFSMKAFSGFRIAGGWRGKGLS